MVAVRRDDSVRERLLGAADELFYEEGVHTVGIDRILERANVAKASLYGTFGSKEDLVCAYLTRRSEQRQAEIAERSAECTSPREKVLAVFELLATRVAESKFRGCAFLNASIEGPRGPTPIRSVATKHRAWMRGYFEGLAKEMGARDPHGVAVQLAMLYDGAIVGSLMEATPETAEYACRMAALLLGAEEKAPHSTPKKGRSKAKPRALSLA
jgi:AcrR family transcriptional regulator